MVRHIKRLPSKLDFHMRFSYETVFKSRLLSLGPLEKAPLEITATQNKSITFFHRGDGDRGEELVTCYHRRKKKGIGANKKRKDIT